MTRQQVLPYLKKMDLVVGEEVVEETLVRYRTSHKIASFRRFTISHFWALIAGPYTSLKRTLLSEGGPSID